MKFAIVAIILICYTALLIVITSRSSKEEKDTDEDN